MSYFDEVLADSPAAYWRMDETAGPTLHDSSGNGRDGAWLTSLSGYVFGEPGLLVGDPSTSIKNTGTLNRVTVPFGAWMDSANFTYECVFMKMNTNWSQLASRYYSGNAHSQFHVDNTGAVRGDVWSGASSWNGVSTAAGVVQPNVPYHAAFSRASDGTLSLRVVNLNTGALTTATGPADFVPIGAPDIYLGAGSLYRMYGWLDEIAFYPSVLSDARLQAHADAAMGVSPTPAGSLGGVAPGVVGSFDGSHTSPPNGGALAGVAPGVLGSFGASHSVPPIDASLAGVAPGVTALFSGGDPNAVTGPLAGSAPAVYGTFAAVSSAAPMPAVVSSSEYANLSGYNYGGLSFVDYDPPIAPAPTRVRREVTRRVHQSLPAPTLVDGRPV